MPNEGFETKTPGTSASASWTTDWQWPPGNPLQIAPIYSSSISNSGSMSTYASIPASQPGWGPNTTGNIPYYFNGYTNINYIPNTIYFRAYVYIPSIPSSSGTFLFGNFTGGWYGTAGAGGINIGKDGSCSTSYCRLDYYDDGAGGSIPIASSNLDGVTAPSGTIPFNQWFRIEGQCNQNTVVNSYRIFKGSNINGNTPDVTITQNAVNYNGGNLYFGISNGGNSIYYDDVAYSSVTWVGPLSSGSGGGGGAVINLKRGPGIVRTT